MKITIELTLFVCLFFNFLILKISALILRENSCNAFLSALIGGEGTLIFPRLSGNLFGKVVMILALSSIILLISFKFSSFADFLRVFSVFLATTFAFGGGVFALQNMIGEMPLFVISACGAGVYILMFVTLKAIQRKNRIKDFCYDVKLIDNGREVIEEGFLDSGNVLYDNITKKPVILVSFDVFHKLYKDISYASVLARSTSDSLVKNGHYLNINSVGSAKSILVFSVDEIVIGEDKNFKNVMVGLSLSGFEKSFGRGILLHSDLV